VDVSETWITNYCKYLATQRSLTRKAKGDENSKTEKKSPQASDKEKGLRTSTINKSVGYLRNVLKSAKKNGQPVGEIPERLKRSTVGGKRSTQREPLDLGDVMKLVALEKLPRHLEIIRDEFILMSFTGVRIGDLLDPAWVITRDRIINNQGKTAGVHCITLNQYSREIIKRYSTVDLHGNFKLDLPDHEGQYLNRQYKRLARMAGVTKNITNHIARHTFAGILADMNLNESLRAAELGHRANKSVTAGYGIMGADSQVKFVSKKWEKVLSLWKGDYEAWYEAVNI
jgi:integrase